ncbi:hypothetical protein NDU88_003384 [Pleurodeles waltl]|uniref:Uncharacterized protein n=1 Tax=Pleurodeles waltl TaxID=8319 RepID=A0AAV7KYT6_PLEWA|nr:hypothetical protein NDU88_003384 [Pleurodeles waltl]
MYRNSCSLENRFVVLTGTEGLPQAPLTRALGLYAAQETQRAGSVQNQFGREEGSRSDSYASCPTRVDGLLGLTSLERTGRDFAAYPLDEKSQDDQTGTVGAQAVGRGPLQGGTGREERRGAYSGEGAERRAVHQQHPPGGNLGLLTPLYCGHLQPRGACPGDLGQKDRLSALRHRLLGGPRQRLEVPLSLLQERGR